MKWYSDCTKWMFLLTFDENTKNRVYNRQTDEAKEKHVSNCPLCAIGHDANKEKNMDAERDGCRPCVSLEQGWSHR